MDEKKTLYVTFEQLGFKGYTSDEYTLTAN